jgi:hypothetical protein
MSGPTPDQVVQALLAKGVSPAQIAAVNPAVGRRVQAGLIAPRLQAPDKIAERGAYVRDYGQINKDRDDLAKVYPVTTDLDRFHSLNTKKATGSIGQQDYDGWEKANPLNWPGMLASTWEKRDPLFKEMSGISSGLQGKARPAGSGSTSDLEQRLYRMGVPSPEKEGPTNDNIINYQKGVISEQNDRLAFQEEFLRRNGSLSGSQDAWTRYIAANPYTVSDKDGRTRLNPQRADWKEHFGVAPPRPQVKTGDTGKPLDTRTPPPTQLKAAMMFRGSKAPRGDRTNPFIPLDPQQFAQIPPGAAYIDDDGKVYTKGRR